MLLLVRFVLLSLVLFYVGCQEIPILQDDGVAARIVNGSKAEQGQFPFAVSLQMHIRENYHLHVCTLSLITTRTCLGAAHCALSADGKVQLPTEVYCGVVGSSIQESNAICYNYSDIIVHEGFQKNGFGLNDIGLFIFEDEMVLDNEFLDTIPLIGPGEVNDSSTIIALGWGNLHKHDEKYTPKMLRYVELQLLPRRKCYIKENQLCISTKGKGICSGDSGGPLIVTQSGKYVQVGISSYTRYECANMKSVGTAVEAYTDWIKNHTFGELTFVNI